MSDRASLGFALGRLLDAAGDYPEAFSVYTAANQASLSSADPASLPTIARYSSAFVDRVIAAARRAPGPIRRDSAATHFHRRDVSLGINAGRAIARGDARCRRGRRNRFSTAAGQQRIVPFFETLGRYHRRAAGQHRGALSRRTAARIGGRCPRDRQAPRTISYTWVLSSVCSRMPRSCIRRAIPWIIVYPFSFCTSSSR